jgi:hypothetical protein
LAVYDPLKDAWSAFDLGAATDRERIAPDGSRAAVQLRRDGPIVLVDLEAMTYRTLPLNALPRDFSPDTRRLVLGLPEDYSGAGPDSRWLVVDFDDPRRAWRLPAGKAGGPGEQSPPIWLSNTVLLSRTQNNTVLQLFDISGPVAKLTLEEPVPSDQIVLSSDHSTVGVQERIDKGSGRPGFDAYEYNVKVYSLSPFKLIATLPGAALGYQLDQPSRPPDDARFLAILDICVEDKSRLVAFNINDGTQDELARGKILQYVFSPDGRWVAFTTWPRNGYVIDADGSSPPRLVSDAISPFTPPAWSADSRYVSFNSFFGGGDYCI